MATTFLVSGLTSLGLMCGYIIVKRIRRSRCAVDTCGVKIDSIPEQLELQKQETSRLEKLITGLITETQSKLGEGSNSPNKPSSANVLSS